MLLLDLMLKISIKFNTITCLVPYDGFLICRCANSNVSESFGNSSRFCQGRVLSDSQLTKCSQDEYNDNDQQPKPFNPTSRAK